MLNDVEEMIKLLCDKSMNKYKKIEWRKLSDLLISYEFLLEVINEFFNKFEIIYRREIINDQEPQELYILKIDEITEIQIHKNQFELFEQILSFKTSQPKWLDIE